jgi:hypothetical protein
MCFLWRLYAQCNVAARQAGGSQWHDCAGGHDWRMLGDWVRRSCHTRHSRRCVGDRQSRSSDEAGRCCDLQDRDRRSRSHVSSLRAAADCPCGLTCHLFVLRSAQPSQAPTASVRSRTRAVQLRHVASTEKASLSNKAISAFAGTRMACTRRSSRASPHACPYGHSVRFATLKTKA